ncbi:penicillin amidase [Streptosporangium becharense]|uniref:Penicillin amidase n=1 Tax=Streptosporangium becharense TaxID=1816182 RepID=A0A7W9MIH1_9ACTN|nr:penicillin acylase family protein [Streptosporangium becharense]MBB2913821.1 penicillin amidase [Streptosporangium becharense]MBB5821518.1 penicillin amidase [Streptosporangium becharense]
MRRRRRAATLLVVCGAVGAVLLPQAIADTAGPVSAGAAPRTGSPEPGEAPRAGAPQTAVLPVAGLRKPVRMVVDRWGVPHIYAESTADLYLAQGFNAARDRLFQIDLGRRRGLGLLSEVLGPAYLEQDRAARLFLYRGDMEREWESYGPGAKEAATRFAEGINAYVDWLARDPRATPPEFRELGYAPARWAPEDVVRIRSHSLAVNLTSEVDRARAVCAGGIGMDPLMRRLQPEWRTTVPDGLDPCALPPDVLRTYHLGTQSVAFRDGRIQVTADPPGPALTEGSNAWAVAPSRTTTGRPILAGDPHRVMKAPSLRYVTHLSAPGLDVIGAGEPALPGISIGHNGTVAFGLTIFGVDQEDLYVYRLDPGDPGRYRYGRGWERFRTVTEDVPVAGGPSRPVELSFTRHGPVIKVDRERNLAYALRTTWLEPGTTPYFGSMKYMRARTWGEFTAAMRTWGGPPENQIYADVRGGIGWVPGGMMPRRTGYDGLLPVPGDGRYEWDGFHDGAGLPRSYNPASGIVASANEFNMPEDHPLKVGFDSWASPYRHERIVEALTSRPRTSPADSAALQSDKVSIPARRLVRLLAGIEATEPSAARALDLLRTYDGVTAADSPRAALFETWFTGHLQPAFAREVLPGEVARQILVHDPLLLLSAMEDPQRWFGAGGAAVRDRIVRTSLAAAYDELSARLGPDPAGWRWGDVQQVTFAHPTGQDVGPFPRGGSWHTVEASNYLPGGYVPLSGPTFKMVLDVGDWDRSIAVNAPGQSGDPRSPHYRDLAPRWQRGEYFPLFYSRAAVERAAGARFLLIPRTGRPAGRPDGG